MDNQDSQVSSSGLNLNKKTIISGVVLLLIIIATALGVYLAQQKQLFKPKAFETIPVSGPETSLSLSGPNLVQPNTQFRVVVKVKSDIEAANLFASKIKFPTDLLKVVSIETGASEVCQARPSCLDAEEFRCMIPEPEGGWCPVPTGGVTNNSKAVAINGGGGIETSFIKNWVEKTFDNVTGDVSLVGGVPNPGYQTSASNPPSTMATIIFETKKEGNGTILFVSDSAIYRNSDNVNILNIKRDLGISIKTPVPTPLPTGPSTEVRNRVFVTSTTYNGNLGGLVGADAKCQARADAAGLGGKWVAWLSDGITPALKRIDHSDGPYRLINGSIVANNWLDLTDGSLQNPINTTELGNIFNNMVWSNTTGYGLTLGGYSCDAWKQSAQGFGAIGVSSARDVNWTFDSSLQTTSCDSKASLYCFEQNPVATTPTPIGISGDVNGDGKITLVDMSALLSKFGKTGSEVGRADLNKDGVVNSIDYSMMIQILIKNGVIKGAQDLPANLKLP